MSTTPATGDAHLDEPAAEVGSGGHAHPSDLTYIKVAIFLGIVTAAEVFTYFRSVHGWGDNALIVMLTLAMVIKFYAVAGWFMHLRFDNTLFSRMFVSGLVLAIGVYLVMLTAFELFA